MLVLLNGKPGSKIQKLHQGFPKYELQNLRAMPHTHRDNFIHLMQNSKQNAKEQTTLKYLYSIKSYKTPAGQKNGASSRLLLGLLVHPLHGKYSMKEMY